MLMQLLYRFCKISQPEIGRLVGGIDSSAVSKARRRLRSRMEREPELRKRFDELSDRLQQMSFDPSPPSPYKEDIQKEMRREIKDVLR